MKESLEQFVKNRREEFDDAIPGNGVWLGIEKSLSTDSNRFRKPLRILGRAAAVLIIFAASWIFHEFRDQRNSLGENSESLYKMVPELKEAELYYSNQVNSMLQELKPYFASYPGLGNEVKTELDALEKAYQSLKEDLNDQVATEEVVEAMIQNYRLKLSILEDILSELKKENEHENQIQQSI